MGNTDNFIGGRTKEREEVLQMLKLNPVVYARFLQLSKEFQEDLIAFCMGNKGLKVTWDPFFKALFNPEVYAGRLSQLLSAILKQNVTVKRALPNESSRLTAEGSLLIMDILVELEDGGLANIEMQRVGYLFPGERGACYSADLVLRQYARVKGDLKDNFSYRDMKKVYTIVLMEKSGKEFKEKKEYYRHHARQVFDTSLNLELLQEYIYIPLDLFLDNYQKSNHNISKELDAWLLFLASDAPADIVRLVEAYPQFRKLYEEIAGFQQRPEELVNMYSEALAIMDRNTVKLMIEEQEQLLAEQAKALAEKDHALAKQANALAEQANALTEKDHALAEQANALTEKDHALAKQANALAEKDKELKALRDALNALRQ